MGSASQTTRTLSGTQVDDDLSSGEGDGRAGPTDALDGRMVGRHLVLAKLGEGGMGTVYAAYDPELDRKVALKILHGQRADASRQTQARARLAREAQAIAKVTHPNVVVVYDVGVVPIDGASQVFIAMELVEGRNLRTWMSQLSRTPRFERGAAWREIVEVLVQAGRGLAAAHAAGVVHRDFKPDNVLVGDDGVVRVLDFGLARRIDGSLDEDPDVPQTASREPKLDARITITGAVLGTPAYMAPEQFRGEAADARTDQFAFCLTLHEALLGVRAFESGSQQALAVAVMEGQRRPIPEHPPVPSHLLAVIDRGLAREPEDRFASMEALLDALTHDPAARRRQWTRWGLTAAGLAAVAGGSAWWAAQAPAAADPCGHGRASLDEVYGAPQREELRAAMSAIDRPFAAHTTATTLRYLDTYAEDWLAGYRDACEATHVRHEQTGTLLDKRVACLQRRLSALDSTVDALTTTDAKGLARAVPLVRDLPPISSCADVVALEAGVALPTDATTRESLDEIVAGLERVRTLELLSRMSDAVALARSLRRRAEALDYPPVAAEATFELGDALSLSGEREEAKRTLFEALSLAQAAGVDAVVRDTASSISTLIGVDLADPEHGLPWADLAEATAARIGWTPQQRMLLLRRRAYILVEWGLDREAIEVAQRALAAAREIYDDDSDPMDGVYSSLGTVYGRLRDFDRAEQYFRRCVEIAERVLGPDHPHMLTAYRNLGNALSAKRETQEARKYLTRAADLADRLPDISGEDQAMILNGLGNLLLAEAEYTEAEAVLGRALALRQEVLGPDHPLVARTLNSLGNVAQQSGRVADAQAYYERSLKIREAAHGPEHPDLVITLSNLATMLINDGRPDEALPYAEQVAKILAAHELDPFRQADHRLWYGRALVETGRDVARGEALVDEAIERLEKLGHEGLLQEARAWRDARRRRAR